MYMADSKKNEQQNLNNKPQWTCKKNPKLCNAINNIVNKCINSINNDPKLHNKYLNILAAIFVFLYVLTTTIWLGHDFYTLLFNRVNVLTWRSYLCIMLLIGAIHIWFYLALKFINIRKALKSLFPKNKYYKKILNHLKALALPLPYVKDCTMVEILLKLFFTILWTGASISIFISCINLCSFNSEGKYNYLLILVFGFLILLGCILNYFSYYSSIAFCYFVREVANEKNIKCEKSCDYPSNSRNLRTLLHISSRISMSFFAVSMMYLLAATIYITPILSKIPLNSNISVDYISQEKYLYTGYYLPRHSSVMLLGLVVILCVFSLVLVSLLSKIFLNRLFRRWKIEKVQHLEANLKEDAITSNEYYTDKITEVLKSKLPFVTMELLSAILTLMVDIISLTECVLKLT